MLSVIEIGLGSLIHGLNIPLGGHLLSLNQGFILSRAHIDLQDKRAGGLISTTAALLKSLSPAGKKLTPMLAIALQGQLFGLGAFILGNNRLGLGLGMSLLCLWGFLQPLFFYSLVFGEKLWKMAQFYVEQLQGVLPVTMENLLWILAFLVFLKVLLGLVIVEMAFRLKATHVEAYSNWSKKFKKEANPRRQGNVFVQSLKELMSPFFSFTLVLMGVFFYFAQSEHSQFVWVLLRPVALGYLMILMLRLLPLEKLTLSLEKKNPRLARSVESALKHLRASTE